MRHRCPAATPKDRRTGSYPDRHRSHRSEPPNYPPVPFFIRIRFSPVSVLFAPVGRTIYTAGGFGFKSRVHFNRIEARDALTSSVSKAKACSANAWRNAGS